MGRLQQGYNRYFRRTGRQEEEEEEEEEVWMLFEESPSPRLLAQ